MDRKNPEKDLKYYSNLSHLDTWQVLLKQDRCLDGMYLHLIQDTDGKKLDSTWI